MAEFRVPSGHLRGLTDGKLRFELYLSRTQVKMFCALSQCTRLFCLGSLPSAHLTVERNLSRSTLPGHPFFLGKGPIPLSWADLPAARVKFPISGTPNRLSCLIFIVNITCYLQMWPRAA